MKNLETLSIQEKSGEAELSLPAGYWQERYEGSIIPKEILDKEKSMRRAERKILSTVSIKDEPKRLENK